MNWNILILITILSLSGTASARIVYFDVIPSPSQAASSPQARTPQSVYDSNGAYLATDQPVLNIVPLAPGDQAGAPIPSPDDPAKTGTADYNVQAYNAEKYENHLLWEQYIQAVQAQFELNAKQAGVNPKRKIAEEIRQLYKKQEATR